MKKLTSNLFGILGTLLVLSSCACEKDTQGNPPKKDKESEEIEIQVGTRKVTTVQFTDKGTPVVPMWKAPMPTANLRTGAGFPILDQAEHAAVWQPAAQSDGAYNHYACIIHHKGRFYAMWGNHALGEDAPGQRVLYAESSEWGKWTDAKELFPAPGPVKPRNESGIHLKPDRWAVVDDVLYAITYVHGAGIYPIARAVYEDGSMGECFLVRGLPANSGLPVFMQDLPNPTVLPETAGKIVDWYAATNQVSWWAKSGEGIPGTGVDGAGLIESFSYKTTKGDMVLMQRYWGTSSNPIHNNRIYVSFNDGTGGWGYPYPTDIPDSPSRAQALTLEDGTVLLIGNQNVNRFDKALYLDRDPMTVSVSKDGYTFDRVFALRTASPTGFRFSGVGGRNPGYAYSSSIIHDGSLYTFYSVGKEDMAITRVPLSAMGL